MRHVWRSRCRAVAFAGAAPAQEQSLIGELEGVDSPHRLRAGKIQRGAAARRAGRRRHAAAGRGARRVRAAGPPAGPRDRQVRRHLAPRLPRAERLGERAPARWLHDRLLFWDYDETEIVPNIAKGYEMSEDGKTIDRPSCARARSGRTASPSPPTTSSSGTKTLPPTRRSIRTPIPELMVAGKPVKIEKVDDYTVRYVSENPYYTLPIKLASVSKLGGFCALWPVRPGRLRARALSSSSSCPSTPARKPSRRWPRTPASTTG